jgi:hypothetical protein
VSDDEPQRLVDVQRFGTASPMMLLISRGPSASSTTATVYGSRALNAGWNAV